MDSKKQTLVKLKYIERSLNDINKDIIKNYKQALQEIKIELLKLEEKGTLNQADIMKYGRLDSIKAKIKTELKSIYKSNYKLIDRNRKQAYIDVYEKTLEEFGIKIPKLNTVNIKAVVENPIYNASFVDAMKGLSAKDFSRLSNIITGGMIQGKTLGEIYMELKDGLNIQTKRALMIARTETLRGLSQGQEEGYQKLIDKGLELEKVWLTIKDDRVRNSHEDLDEQSADEDGYFHGWTIENKQRIDFITPQPRMSGYASSDINCRCLTYLRKKQED